MNGTYYKQVLQFHTLDRQAKLILESYCKLKNDICFFNYVSSFKLDLDYH